MPIDLFSKTLLPEKIPTEMQVIIDELKKTSDQEECLKKAYEIMIKKYRGYRVKTYTKIFQIFKKDLNYLWSREGFLHCTNINFVMRILLIKSEFFREEDVILKWTQVWLVSPHQYLQVNVNGKWINVDIWANSYGINFGNHAQGFH